MSFYNNLPLVDNSLDRHGIFRGDSAWIEEKLSAPNTLFIANWNNRFPVQDNGQIYLLSKAQLDELSDEQLNYSYLGQMTDRDQAHIFSSEIVKPQVATEDWKSLRRINIDDPAAGLATYSQGLTNWHNKYKFCTHCGTALELLDGGNRMLCQNQQCKQEIFPRIEPAIIVLVTYQDQCLLANGHKYKGSTKMHSCLAGFMETGEDFDMAVRREVWEETGVELTDIIYRANQPWPFPQGLMIGFHAEAKTQQLEFHDGEINSAQWLTAEQIMHAVEENEILLPSPKSISYYLLAEWFLDQTQIDLAEFMKNRWPS